MKDRWYKDGLRFTCTQCGACCCGAPGHVWVDQDEVAALANLLSMEPEAFRDRYVRRVGGRYSLIEYSDGDCVFFNTETRGCNVYEARPTQCRTWPFWNSSLKSEQSWKQTCQECPGAGTGTLYSIEKIEQARNQKRV